MTYLHTSQNLYFDQYLSKRVKMVNMPEFRLRWISFLFLYWYKKFWPFQTEQNRIDKYE